LHDDIVIGCHVHVISAIALYYQEGGDCSNWCAVQSYTTVCIV
jgi:hypothetical protein